MRSVIAAAAAGAVIAGSLVAIGVGAQQAQATDVAPGVSVVEPESYLAGEDLALELRFTGSAGAGDQYNLSAGIVLPADAVLVPGSTDAILGTPRSYPAGAKLKHAIAAGTTPDSCGALGLDVDPEAATACVVPEGMQYWVFENIADLPEGADVEATLTVRPKAGTFGVGESFDYRVNAYTSSEPRYLPVFPGSTGVGSDDAIAGTSNAGVRDRDIEVNALLVDKVEPSPEDELLRGVHDHPTTYTLNIWHTGEGDVANTTVTDFIPAGLEYLGLGGTDNTTNANGTQGGGDASVEYPGAARLDATGAPEGGIGYDGQTAGETVETVIPTAEEVEQYGLVAGAVYTKVTWNLGTLLAQDDERSATTGEGDDAALHGGVAQQYEDGAGEPGLIQIKYRAGVPLFENTLDFIGADGAYDPAVDGQQIANLDNNTGASTRHGTADLEDRGGRADSDGVRSGADANAYTNVAVAAGTYGAAELAVEDHDAAHIDAVDVRVLKTVNGNAVGVDGDFSQGELARYNLEISTSEYVAASIGDPTDTGEKNHDVLRLVDDMANGLCPVFGEGTDVFYDSTNTNAENTEATPLPNLLIGGYGAGSDAPRDRVSAEEWNAALIAAGIDDDCQWDAQAGHSTGAGADAALENASLSGIAFEPATGHFYLEYTLDGENDEQNLGRPNATVNVAYSVHQNSRYTADNGVSNGATSSMDRFENEAEILARTAPIDAIDGVDTPSGTAAPGEWNAWDNSYAWVKAGATGITKEVLQRSEGAPGRDQIFSSAYDDNWVSAADENTPYAVGDQTWYRIVVSPPSGADVRNPVFTDFLPQGVELDLAPRVDGTDRPENIRVTPADRTTRDAVTPGLGTCDTFANETEWLDTFVPADSDNMKLDGRALTMRLGSADCLPGSTDRFMPFRADLEIYLKVTITDPQAFAQEDLSQNLAKFRYTNVDGKVFALRDQAEIMVDRTPKLVKGVRAVAEVDGTTVSAQRPADEQTSNNGDVFDSDRDGIEVVQGEKVAYRLDVTAPYAETSDYTIIDALPTGIARADIAGADPSTGLIAPANGDRMTGATAAGYSADDDVETPLPEGSWEAYVYDPDDAGYPSNLAPSVTDENRSVIVWTVTSEIASSSRAVRDGDDVIDAVDRGFTLGYTVTIPDGTTDTEAAQITQRYDNDASIVSYGSTTNTGGESTTYLASDDSVAEAPAADDLGAGEYVYEDEAGDASDDSNVHLPGAEFAKNLISTEVQPDGALGGTDAGNNTAAQITQGEYATYRYSVTIPAHTSVAKGQLSDGGAFARTSSNPATPVPYRYVAGSAQFFVNAMDEADECVDGTLSALGAEFTCEESVTVDGATRYGVLTFPDTYQNDTDTDQVISAEITVWVQDQDGTNANGLKGHTPVLSQNQELTNTASFGYIDPATNEATSTDKTAKAIYVEPEPTLAKKLIESDGEPVTGTDPTVKPSRSATYRLTVSNAQNRPALFDGVVYDCLPADLEDPRDFVASSGSAEVVDGVHCALNSAGNVQLDDNGEPQNTGDGTLIEWTLGAAVHYGANATLDYTVTVHPETGASQVIPNGASLIGYTLPAEIGEGDDAVDTTDRRGDRLKTATTSVRVAPAAIAKTVDAEQAPVGDELTYTVTATFPADANYYDVTLTDTPAAGIDIDFDSFDVVIDWADAPDEPTVTSPTALNADGELVWTLDGDDIKRFDAERTITITYTARVTDTVTSATPTNTAELAWNARNGDDDTRTPVTDDAEVTLVNPVLHIDKTVDGETSITREAGDSFAYALTVTNTGGTPAYQTTITDVVPDGVVVDPDSITDAPGDPAVPGVLTGADPETGAGGTITWTDVTGPLAPSTAGDELDETNSIVLGYTATFAPSAQLAAEDFAYENVADVTKYESFDEGGWTYEPGTTGKPSSRNPGGVTDLPRVTDEAETTPLFPHVVPEKHVTVSAGTDPETGDDYGVALAGEPFSWTLTATNTGEGAAQQVSLRDTLPENWAFTEVTSVTVAGAAVASDELPAPQLSGDGNRTLTWSFGQVAAGDDPVAPVLEAGESIEIVFTATPSDAARTEAPGTGILVRDHVHTNILAVTATDTQNADENGDDDYVGDDSEADAYIAEADLLLVKDAIGGTDADTTITALPENVELPKGSWVPGAEPGDEIGDAGYTEPQWRITVTNQGPDDSAGPFAFTDAMQLPAGVTVDDPALWSATYFASADDATGTPLQIGAVTGDGTADVPYAFEVSGTVDGRPVSLSAAGDDRIVLVADVTVLAEATGTAENVADVLGATFERESKQDDNEDDAEKPLSPLADLIIAKERSNPSLPNAGEEITWTLTPRNEGLADSVNGQGADGAKITVTDTVPAHISDVADPSNADWAATVTRGGESSTFPATAGDVITWTFTGDRIAAGADGPGISLAGMIDSGWVKADGDIINEARIDPGETPDPDPSNNEDDVWTDPTDETSVGITKMIVERADDGRWVPAAEIAAYAGSYPFTPGEDISYRLQVVNNGPADARNVVVRDQVPEGLSYASHVNVDENGAETAPEWSYAADQGEDVFTLAGTQLAHTSKYIVVTYHTAPSTSETVANCATVDAENDQRSDADQQSSCAQVDRLRDANLSLDKIATESRDGDETDTAVAGTSLWYRVVVTNEGPSDSSAPIDVRDVLPEGFTYVPGTTQVGGAAAADPALSTVTSGDGDAATEQQRLDWTDLTDGDDLAYQGTIAITYQVTIDEALRQHTAVNEAYVTGPEDSDESDNGDDAPVKLIDQTEMAIVKTVADGPWVAGTDVTYTLDVVNSGPSAAPATVTDTLPAGLTMVSMSSDSGWSCDAEPGAQTGSCDYTANGALHPVNVGQPTQITVVAHIAPSAASLEQPLTNTAVLSWTDSEGAHEDDDAADITVTRAADLGIEKLALTEAGGDPTEVVTPGSPLWYRLDVWNDGPSDAVGPIVVHDELPAGMRFTALTDDAVAAGWTATVEAGAGDAADGAGDAADGADDVARDRVTFTHPAGILLGEHAPLIEFEVATDASIATDTQLVNTAELDREATLDPNGDPSDPAIDEAADSDDATVTATRAVDLAIAKTHDADQVRVGSSLTFDVTVTNNGPSVATGVTVTDTVPAGLKVRGDVYDVIVPGDGVWTIESITPHKDGTTTLVATLSGELAPGETSSVLKVFTTVLDGAYPTVTNTAAVTGTEPDTDPSNNTADDEVTVPALSTLNLTKTAVGTFQVGEIGEYRLTVENTGPTEDPGPIRVVDELPDGLTFVSSPDDNVTVSGQTVTWTIEDGLAVGEKVEFTLKTRIGQAAFPSVVNTAAVLSDTEQTRDAEVTDDATATVDPADPLTVTGSDTAAFVVAGAVLLLLLGGAAVLMARRRKTASPS